MMNTKEKILENLDGERAKQVWELIEKAVKEIYKDNIKIPKETEKKYFSCEDIINDKTHRYLIIEQYNLDEGFYFRHYKEFSNTTEMFEDYFSDAGGWEEILLVDMKEMKCYLLGKEVSYSKEEVKIK